MQELIENEAGQSGVPAVKAWGSGDLIERFLAEHDVRPTSRTTYRAGLLRFFSWFESNAVPPATEAHAIAFKNYLESESLSSYTVSAYLTVLRLFFKWTARIGLSRDVAAELKLPKLPKGFRKDPLTAAQVRDLLAGIDRSSLAGKRDYALIALAVARGLRTIELRRLDVGDIRVLNGAHVLQIHGKGRDCKDQTVPLSEPVLKPILAYLQARGASSDSEPMFCSVADSNHGQRLTTFSISRICKDHIRRFGVNSRRLTAHSLRHTCATLATPDNATFTDVESVQALLRHESLSTSMIYMHNEKSGNAAAIRVDSYLFGEEAENGAGEVAQAAGPVRTGQNEADLLTIFRSLPQSEQQAFLRNAEQTYQGQITVTNQVSN